MLENPKWKNDDGKASTPVVGSRVVASIGVSGGEEDGDIYRGSATATEPTTSGEHLVAGIVVWRLGRFMNIIADLKTL